MDALAFFQIAYSEEREQLVIDGQSFTADGEDHARFWSVSASRDASTLELYYSWKGDHEGSDEDVTTMLSRADRATRRQLSASVFAAVRHDAQPV